MSFNAYYNGEFKSIEDIHIPLTDRAVFFGDGIYDAAIGRNGKIFMLDEHIERFFSNLNYIGLPFSYSPVQLKKLLLEIVRLSDEKSYFVYFQLSRYSKNRVHAFPESEKSNLLITVTPFTLADEDKKVKLIIDEDRRHALCNIKTINLLPAVLASHRADLCGADETIFTKNGIVTECSHSNVHIIKNSVLFTHPLDSSILPGISRMHLLSLCRKLGVNYIERPFSVKELIEADEVLVTSSSKLAVLASEIEGKIFDEKKDSLGKMLAKAMREEYLALTL